MKTHTLRSLSAADGKKIVRKVDGFRVKLSEIIVVDGFNVRTEREELREHIAGIAAALSAGERVQDLEVWINPQGKPELVDGHCTYNGYQLYAQSATDFDGWVSAKEFRGTEAQKKARIGKSNRQLPLLPIELGNLYLSLRDEHGMTRQEIAIEMGRSPAHVDQMLLLASAPETLKQAVESGKISATEAVKLARDHGQDSAAELERREELAKEQGKERITPKVAPKKPASRPRIDFVVSCASVLTTHIERDTELMDQLKSAGKDDRVSVSADLLLDLIESVREMRDAGKPLDAEQQQELGL